MGVSMPKYAPLGDFLRRQRGATVPMTFAQIERIIGAKLPPSQRNRAWWSNNPWNNVMTKVWLDAGFVSEQVDIEGRKLVFRRVGKEHPPMGQFQEAQQPEGQFASGRHPLFGALKGLVRVPAETDLTEPADPEWGENA
jgi:hypothetical protein